MVKKEVRSSGVMAVAPAKTRGFFKKQKVRDQLIGSVLKGSWKAPNDEGLDHLVFYLNGLREFIWLNRGPWKEHRERCAAVDRALKCIAQHAPILLEELRFAAKSFKGASSLQASFQTDAETLERLQAAIDSVESRKFLEMGRLDDGHVDNWKHIAPTLGEIFRTALAATNPGKTLGNSNEGPVARFAHLVIPDITGESPKLSTVSAFLKHGILEGRALPG